NIFINDVAYDDCISSCQSLSRPLRTVDAAPVEQLRFLERISHSTHKLHIAKGSAIFKITDRQAEYFFRQTCTSHHVLNSQIRICMGESRHCRIAVQNNITFWNQRFPGQHLAKLSDGFPEPACNPLTFTGIQYNRDKIKIKSWHDCLQIRNLTHTRQ